MNVNAMPHWKLVLTENAGELTASKDRHTIRVLMSLFTSLPINDMPLSCAHDEIFKALRRAISRWLHTTDEGRAILLSHEGRFSVMNFMCQYRTRESLTCLELEGIYDLHCEFFYGARPQIVTGWDIHTDLSTDKPELENVEIQSDQK